MKKLRLNCINGFYNEMYNPNPYSFENDITIVNSYLDVNQCFWNNILSEKSINHLLKIAKYDTSKEFDIPQVLSAVNNESIFLKNINEAKTRICDQDISPQTFFKYIETLEILCVLYSKYIYDDLPFTINEAFIINEMSSKKLYLNCTKRNANPLLEWILDKIIPVIVDYNPDIIFFEGKPSIFSFSIAKILKRLDLKAHLCITNNASEYYSLSKIHKYLLNNQYLFKAFDSIILNHFQDVEMEIINTLSNNQSLTQISDLIFYDGEKICFNSLSNSGRTKLSIVTRSKSDNSSFIIPPHEIIDVHILPSCKCYWNKCAFCGINKKYSFNDCDDDNIFNDNLVYLKSYILKNNIKYVWFVDEAIPILRLRQIAEFFIKEKIKVLWQARCRIEIDLVYNSMPKLLYDSGLRELRLGLESASIKVLNLMNKFPNGFSLSIVDRIIYEYHTYGVFIHFPMIIGFPGETQEDRRITYEYLSKITNKYNGTSFNINVLYLDVSSKLFSNWAEYGIRKIDLPCPANEFLGNIANFNTIDRVVLHREQDNVMKELLYPWYPDHALIKPHIFYRLSETIRNTLIWKSKRMHNYEDSESFLSDRMIKISDNLTINQISEDEYIVYNWDTHRYLIANKQFLNFLNNYSESKDINDLVGMAKGNLISGFKYMDYFATVNKLLKYGFLHYCDKYSDVNDSYDDITKYYDNMYITESYDYNITTNQWLINNINTISKGYVLDIGIGLGTNIDLLINNGFYVHGIDISRNVINKLRNKYDKSKCEFYCCDIARTGLMDNTYNLIICSMSLHYLSIKDIVNTISKIKKALKKGGTLYIKVLSTEDALYDNSNNTLIRHFFSKEELITYFYDMKIVEIREIQALDKVRNLLKPYWGIIECIVEKQ